MAITFDLLPAAMEETIDRLDSIEKLLMKMQQPAPLPQGTDYITRKQAAELLHCSLVSLHAWAKQGKVKLYHFAGKTYLNKSEVMAAMKPVSYDLKQKGGSK
ncbi:MAG: DNA-binding protein [Chitinophagaceae bacterium]|nr:MAG: DNA-binding protein [Chitinophagaceae bacterium]